MSAGVETADVMKARVAAILVNWRQPQLTIQAALALERQTVCPIIVVVDNGSGDDSVNQMQAALPGLLIVARGTNGGFGAGCNAGIEVAISMGIDYIWLINNDAAPEAHCLEYLLARASDDPEIGVVGARIRDPSGAIADHAGCIMNPFTFNCRYTLSENEIASSRYAWITGASMLLPTRALKKTGFFDVNYFMYWEDADLCQRLRREGYKLAISDKALVEHEAGTSSNEIQLRRYQWHIESQLLWVSRNYSNVIYGVFLIYSRHFLKSIQMRDWTRFKMTARSLNSGIRIFFHKEKTGPI